MSEKVTTGVAITSKNKLKMTNHSMNTPTNECTNPCIFFHEGNDSSCYHHYLRTLYILSTNLPNRLSNTVEHKMRNYQKQ